MKKNIFLITGACGSGKSYFAQVLKKKMKKDKVRLHDFDEKLGELDNLEATSYFLNLAKEYHTEGFSLVICGGITPLDILNSDSYDKDYTLHGCLLNISDKERKDRLSQRNQNFFKAVNVNNLPLEDFLQAVCFSGNYYKNLIKKADTYIELDNTEKYQEKSVTTIYDWILSKMKE